MSKTPQRSYAEAAAELEHAREEYSRGEALVNLPYRQTRIRLLCLVAMPVLYFGGKALLKLVLGELTQFVTILLTAFAILLPLAVYSAKRSSHMNLVGVGTALMNRNKAEIERLEAELAQMSNDSVDENAGGVANE